MIKDTLSSGVPIAHRIYVIHNVVYTLNMIHYFKNVYVLNYYVYILLMYIGTYIRLLSRRGNIFKQYNHFPPKMCSSNMNMWRVKQGRCILAQYYWGYTCHVC